MTYYVTADSDHGLGAQWQATQLSADYDNAGTLDIFVATDLQPGDGSVDPFGTGADSLRNIELPDAPARPAGEDFIIVSIENGESIDGSLDGVSGSFSCANVDGCEFIEDHQTGDYSTFDPGITFTPTGGTPQDVARAPFTTVASADYLAFGYWLYVPETIADMDDYDFGVFGSGGDPFNAANLAGLTGTATYEGAAVGMYYLNGLSGSPDVGSFSAQVTLMADFGDGSATGFISGEVNTFEYEGDVAASLPTAVTLASSTYDYIPDAFGVPQGSTNIFDTAWRDDAGPIPGGHIGGTTEASVGEGTWYGFWSGAFYGNDPNDANAHPTGVAGAFGSYDYNDGGRSENGLTGSFAAQRQDGS